MFFTLFLFARTKDCDVTIAENWPEWNDIFCMGRISNERCKKKKKSEIFFVCCCATKKKSSLFSVWHVTNKQTKTWTDALQNNACFSWKTWATGAKMACAAQNGRAQQHRRCRRVAFACVCLEANDYIAMHIVAGFTRARCEHFLACTRRPSNKNNSYWQHATLHVLPCYFYSFSFCS